MDATITPDLSITIHRDGTVSYWSVYEQCWRRDYANAIADRDLAAMNDDERERIRRHAAATAPTRTPQTLDELLEVLRAAAQAEDEAEYGRAHGLPVAHGEIDYTSLPTFGGPEPARSREVWSWDERRLLVGAGRDDLEIVEREA